MPREIFSFLLKNKVWWIAPIIITFILLGVLIWVAQESAAVPFIYTLF